jgi:uncharacterized protein YgbK (DUF1537 family)
MLIGAIADDLTGATDLALMLSRAGMRVLQVVGIPPEGFDHSKADAIVVALKSRTVDASKAIDMSLGALRYLQKSGAQQIIFKYCSTFDSTETGNIGPVTDALLAEMGEDFTIVCPAFPANGRTIYKGNLFVGDLLLNESPMKDHPLTPMRDANLVRLMQAQSMGKVGLVTREIVARGEAATRERFDEMKAQGVKIAVVDAIDNQDLMVIGKAISDMRLITGGSGIALGLPDNYRRAGQLEISQSKRNFEAPKGRSVILAGSCSQATREQVRTAIDAGYPAFKIDPVAIYDGSLTVEQLTNWVVDQTHGVPLIYSSEEPDVVRKSQERFGRDEAGQMIEAFLSALADSLRQIGFNRFLVAGGETSGAVVEALGVKILMIGDEIDPGVPWTLAIDSDPPIMLALKSGNFGARDFFSKAWGLLDG